MLGRFDVATTGRGTDWIDLAADQKTLFYSGEGRIISRYNVATSTQLADFATLPGSGNAFALRLLGDGGLLVADASNIKRLDGAGNVIQIYDTPGEDFFFALNLDPNGTDFWTAGYSTGNVYKFNVSSGLLKTTIDTPGGNGVSGLVVKGELTQGNPSVPEPSTVIFGVALSFVCGALRSRRSR